MMEVMCSPRVMLLFCSPPGPSDLGVLASILDVVGLFSLSDTCPDPLCGVLGIGEDCTGLCWDSWTQRFLPCMAGGDFWSGGVECGTGCGAESGGSCFGRGIEDTTEDASGLVVAVSSVELLIWWMIIASIKFAAVKEACLSLPERFVPLGS